MPKPAMLDVRHGSGGDERRGPSRGAAEEWVEAIETSGDQEHLPCSKILHKKTTRVKLNGTRIFSSELTNGNEAGDYVWGNENIGEAEVVRGKGDRADGRHMNVLAIADKDASRHMR